MIHSIIESIINEFASLSFVDKYGGIVYPAQRKITDEAGAAVIKTFPVYGNNKTTCAGDDYMELIPDERHKSVIYFESTPEVIEECWGDKVRASCTLTLVAWFNLPRINQVFTAYNAAYQTEAMMRNLAYYVKGKHTAPGYSDPVDIELTEFNMRDPGIFSRWSYSEAEKQYLIYPFDFAAATFTVQMIYNLCDNEPDIDPDCLNK